MPKIVLALLALVLTLAACGGAPTGVTAQQITDALTAAGATNVRAEALAAEVPVPKSYTAHYVFEAPSVAPKGGQVFVCDTKQNCDAIYAYYDALKMLAGPYLYQSPSGTVVAQLNNGLTPDEAAKFEQAIKSLP